MPLTVSGILGLLGGVGGLLGTALLGGDRRRVFQQQRHEIVHVRDRQLVVVPISMAEKGHASTHRPHIMHAPSS